MSLEVSEKNVCRVKRSIKLFCNVQKSRFVKVLLSEMRSKCPFGSPLPIPFFEYTQQALIASSLWQHHKYSLNSKSGTQEKGR